MTGATAGAAAGTAGTAQLRVTPRAPSRFPGMPTTRPVPRLARTLDLVALALAATGATAYARAYLGMRELQGLAGASPFAGAAMTEFDRWWRLSRYGMVVFGLGLLVAGGAALTAWRARRADAA